MKRSRFLSLAVALLTVLVWVVMPVSNAALAAAPAVPSPHAPTGLRATGAGNDWVRLGWAASAGAKSYLIYVAKSSGGTYSYKGTSTGAGYTVRGLAMGKTYWFKVKAKNATGTSGFSSAVSRKTLSALTAPTTFKATAASMTQINLTWKAVSGATSYQVYRSIGTSKTYTKIASVNVPKYNNTGLKAKTKYNYKVKAVRGSTQSAFSAVVSSYVKLATPNGVKATKAGETQIKVTWNAAAGATGYKLYYSSTEAGPFKTLAILPVKTSFIHDGLAPGTYYYKVASMMGEQVSAPSAPISFVLSGAKPAAPEFYIDLSNNGDGSTVNVLFTESGHVNRTSLKFLYRYSDASEWMSMTFDGSQTTFTLPGVPAGYPVYTKFVAYNGTTVGDTRTYNPFASLLSSDQLSSTVDSANLQATISCGSVPYSDGINFYVSTLQPDGTFSRYKYMDYKIQDGNPYNMTLANNDKFTFAHGQTYKVMAIPYVSFTDSSGSYAEAESVYDKSISITFN
jgi:hypothetical protein